ncbi:MAG: MFS transporter [Proteobacteria bacterium]|nr:MFS transporter [Pseudomonadota bacterium]
MAEAPGVSTVWLTLRNRNFRNYAMGNFASQMGVWVQRIAVQWLTWELTHSPTWLGIIAFADVFPNVVIAPLAGALADRVDRLQAMRIYISLSACLLTAMAALVLSDAITKELLLALVLVNGVVMAFYSPVRLSIIPALVDRELLTSAISFSSVTFNIGRVGGPALAGLIILQWGVGQAFVFTAVADVALILTLCLIRLVATREKREPRSLRHIPAEIMDGFRYARKHPGIGPLLVILMATTVLLRPFNDLFAGFADDVFGRGALGLAWLTSMLGVGAFTASVFLTRRAGIDGLTGLMVASMAVFAIALVGFTATDIFWFACACTAIAGFAMTTIGVAEQSLLQASVDDAMRGRILSLYTLISRGFPSIGALIMGYAASFVGLRWPVLGGAVACLVFWLWARRRQGRMAAVLETPPKTG